MVDFLFGGERGNQYLFSKQKINSLLENRGNDNLKELGIDGNYENNLKEK